MPDHVDANGDLILDGDGEECGWVDFEVCKGGGDGSCYVMLGSLDDLVERDVGVVRGVAGELHFEVAVEGGRFEDGFRQAEAYGDDGELGSAGDLKHVKVAIAVA